MASKTGKTDEPDDMNDINMEGLGGNKQDESERRKIRAGYHQLMGELQINKEELIDPKSNTLTEKLKEADELYKPVKTTREAALDSQAISMIASLGKQKAQALNTEFIKFQPIEFSEKLLEFVSNQQLQQGDVAKISAEGWQKLGEAVNGFFRKTPSFHCLYGTFEPGEIQTVKKVPRPREKDSNLQDKATIPKESTKFAEESNEATTAEVEKVLDLLQREYENNNHELICYFDFVINPHSFGQTVENMFYVSFLIRDGHARISLDADKLPVIEPVNSQEAEAAKENSRSHQVVMSLTPAEWREIVETFKIEEPKIPTRHNTSTMDLS